MQQQLRRVISPSRSPLANLARAGYTYHLLHIQTHPIAASAMVGNADAAGLAVEGQLSFDKERVSSTVFELAWGKFNIAVSDQR